MPTRKPFDKYPSVYEELFRRALEQDVKIPCATVASAKTLRTDLYNYRAAVRDMAEQNLNYLDLSAACDGVQISRHGASITLHQPLRQKFADIITKAIANGT